jgi:hypothetical protein
MTTPAVSLEEVTLVNGCGSVVEEIPGFTSVGLAEQATNVKIIAIDTKYR